MKFYSTIYTVRCVDYSSFVFATSREEAKSFIAIRGIGETILGELAEKQFNASPLPSKLYQDRKLIPAVHCLTFYAWIAGQYMNVHDMMMRDDGILHEILHELEHPKDNGFREPIFHHLLELEKLIPGLKTFDKTLFKTKFSGSWFS